MTPTHAIVIVLGDTGRSPRMQFHAASLAQSGVVDGVTIVGYEGERCVCAVASDPRITDHRLSTHTSRVLRCVPLIGTVLKGVMVMLQVLWALLWAPRYQVLLVQNPPCLPVVFVACAMSLVNGSSVVVDWHNLGFSMFLSDSNAVHTAIQQGLAAPLPSVLARVSRY
jgi:beta-1,4-mannosyltransferase